MGLACPALGVAVLTNAGAPPAMPGGFSFEAGTSTPPPERASSRGAEAGSIQTRFEVDQTQPTTSVQVRLADGTR